MADKLRVVFEFNESELAKFNKMLKDSDVAAKQITDDLKGIDRESEKAFSQAANGVNQLVTGVKAFLGLEIVNYLKNVAVEASKVAAAGEGVRSAYSNLGGSAAELKKLSDAVNGTVSNVNLMKVAVQSLQKGVGLNTLGDILGYVNTQADATGQSLEGLADIAINAIGKQSTKGLQQLGLSVKGIEERAKAIGFMPALMEEIATQTKNLGDVSNPTADAYERLATAQDNLKEAFGRVVNSSGFIELKEFISKELTQLADFLNDPKGLELQTSEQLLAMYQKSLDETARLEDEYTKTRNPIKLNRLRKQLEEEKELRLDIMIKSQELEKAAEEQGKKIAVAEAAAIKAQQDADREAAAKARAEADALAYSKAIGDATKKAQAETAAARQAEFFKGESEKMRAGVSAGMTQITPGFSDAFNLDQSDKTQDKKTLEVFEEAEDMTGNMKMDFGEMLAYTVTLTNLLNGLGNEDGGAMSFFSKIFKGFGTILMMIPGGQVAGGILGGFGALFGQFNEGGQVGQPVGPNRDTVLAGLTLGEYVVKRESSKRSALLLDAINAGELDDRIFAKLQSAPVVVNVDQDRVVKAIESMPQIDFYKSGSALYEVRRSAAERRVSRKQRISL